MKMKIRVVAAVATGSDQYLYFFLPFILCMSYVRNADLNGPENVDLGGPADSLINHGTVGPRVWKVYTRRGRKVTTV
jgi:hypothetical protein